MNVLIINLTLLKMGSPMDAGPLLRYSGPCRGWCIMGQFERAPSPRSTTTSVPEIGRLPSRSVGSHDERDGGLDLRNLTGPADFLALQRQAGNSAVVQLLQAGVVVQRVGTQIDAPGINSLRVSLQLLTPHANAVHLLLAKPKEIDKKIKSLAFSYGLTDFNEDQLNAAGIVTRTKTVPSKDKPLMKAAMAVERDIRGAQQVVRDALGPGYDHDFTKTNLSGPEAALFDDVRALWPVMRDMYMVAQPGFEKKKVPAGGGAPVAADDNTKRQFLPAADVVKKAPGPIGKELRRLCRKKFLTVALTQADVDGLYVAYNKTAWRYNPVAAPSAHDLILGHSNTAVCGALAAALVEMVGLVAQCRQLASNPAHIDSLADPFVSMPYQFGFIDRAVKGNIEAIVPLDPAGRVDGYANVNRAKWSSHTWMVAFGTTYDPLGRQAAYNFKDATFGNPVKAGEAWRLQPATGRPPAGFDTGYRLVQQH